MICRWVGPAVLRGNVVIRSLAPGSHWRKAKPGEFLGTYLLRTGARSSVHLQEFAGEVYRPTRPWGVRPRSVACVDSLSVVRFPTNCGYRVQVLQGRMSAADGKPGKSLGPALSG